MPSDNAWDCNHHPEWADDKNRCHHPAHDTDQLALDLEPLSTEGIGAHLTIQERFEAFHRLNPSVYTALVALTREYLATGRTRVGVGMLFERLRWAYDTTTTGDPFRLNNDYRSRYVRKIVAEHPEFADAFETRTLRAA